MARLSAENSAEHLAAINTPDPKTARKSSRFKEFFKSGHSRGSLSSGYDASPAGSTPPSGLENLKPGFEKVGLLPSERSPGSDTTESQPVKQSRVLDLENLKKRIEEHRDLGHLAEVEPYKEREGIKGRESEGEQHVESLRHESSKVMNVPHIEGNPTEDETAANVLRVTAVEDKKASDAADLTQQQQKEHSKNATNEELIKALDRACASSISTSVGSGPANSTLDRSRLPSLRHSPPLSGLRSTSQRQVLPSDSISNIGNQLEEDSTRTNVSMSPDQNITDPNSLREFYFHRFSPTRADITSPQNRAIDRIHSKIRAQLGASPQTHSPTTNNFKLGPYDLEISTARALTESLLPFTYLLVLFIKAMQGPSEFVVALWKLLVLASAYAGLRRIMRWQEDGSKDILLAPIEELGDMSKQYCMEMMASFLGSLAHATVVALRELEREDED